MSISGILDERKHLNLTFFDNKRLGEKSQQYNLWRKQIGKLTSVWMVQDHQFSVGLSNLGLVGCGTKKQKKCVSEQFGCGLQS